MRWPTSASVVLALLLIRHPYLQLRLVQFNVQFTKDDSHDGEVGGEGASHGEVGTIHGGGESAPTTAVDPLELDAQTLALEHRPVEQREEELQERGALIGQDHGGEPLRVVHETG